MVRFGAAAVAAVFILTGASVAGAQSPAPTDQVSPASADGPVLEVIGVEYAYEEAPAEVPVGSSLSLTNGGSEVHEILLYRVNDGVTETLDELLTMEDPEAAGLVELVGDGPLIAVPGATAEGTLPLEREGRYAIVCFIPQGLTAEIFEALPPDVGPADLPPELQAAPPHVALGMAQEFTVTALASSPDAAASHEPVVGESPAGDGS
jgi:hypothetical protein